MKKLFLKIFLIICVVIDSILSLLGLLCISTELILGDGEVLFFIGLEIVFVLWLVISIVSLCRVNTKRKNIASSSMLMKISIGSFGFGFSFPSMEDGIYPFVCFMILGVMIGLASYAVTKFPLKGKDVYRLFFQGYNAAENWYSAAVEYLLLNNRELSQLNTEKPKPKYTCVRDYLETDFRGLTEEDKEKITDYACNPIIYLTQWLIENKHIGHNFYVNYNRENVTNVLNGYIPVTRFFRNDMDYMLDNNDISDKIREFLVYYYGTFYKTKIFRRDDDNYFFDYCELIQSKGASFFCCDYHYDIYREFKTIFDKRYENFRYSFDYYKSGKYVSFPEMVRWKLFNADLDIYTYEGHTEEHIKKCSDTLNNLSVKELNRLKRRIESIFEKNDKKIDFEKMFRPTRICIYESRNDDVYFYVDGEAEFEGEHGIGFTILNGIVLDVGYAFDNNPPYSRRDMDLYELGNNDIDFAALTEQAAVDKHVSEGELVAVKMEFDGMKQHGENNNGNEIYLTPAAEKIFRDDMRRLKILCKCGIVRNIGISCKKSGNVIVPAEVYMKGFVSVKENGENKNLCRYTNIINVWY